MKLFDETYRDGNNDPPANDPGSIFIGHEDDGVTTIQMRGNRSTHGGVLTLPTEIWQEMSEGSWAINQRQAWIAETVTIFGFINREHIMRKFDVSLPQASADLARFRKLNPNKIAYNASAKRYEPI